MSIQDASDVAMAQKQVNKITTFQTLWRSLLWTPACKTGESKEKKGWLCLVTCFVVKALHLDIVDDLTVEVFLMRLRRFIAKSHL